MGSGASSEEECASQHSSDGGYECWDMAEGDDEALMKVVMQKTSRCRSLCRASHALAPCTAERFCQ